MAGIGLDKSGEVFGNTCSQKGLGNALHSFSDSDESGGLIDAVTDDEILAAYKLLASKEGIFVEPASAASVAGILKLAKRGFFNEKRRTKNEERIRIVCVLTGHGLKDPDRAIASVDKPVVLEPKADLILKEMGL